MTRIAIILGALLLSTPAFATVNTLTLVDEYTDGSSKICVYSNGDRTETAERSRASACPSKKTFH